MATLRIEFKVYSLQDAVRYCRTNMQSLRHRLAGLEELDERRRIATQHIDAIQHRQKITFNKRHKKMALQPSMMVMMQDGEKMEFPIKFDAVWLGPYLGHEVFPNNFLQLKTLNGESFPSRTSGSRCKQYRAWKRQLTCQQAASRIQCKMLAN